MDKRYHENVRPLLEEGLLAKAKRVCMNIIRSITDFVRDIWQKICTKIKELKEKFRNNPRVQRLLGKINNNKVMKALGVAKNGKHKVEKSNSVEEVEQCKKELYDAKEMQKEELENVKEVFEEVKKEISSNEEDIDEIKKFDVELDDEIIKVFIVTTKERKLIRKIDVSYIDGYISTHTISSIARSAARNAEDICSFNSTYRKCKKDDKIFDALEEKVKNVLNDFVASKKSKKNNSYEDEENENKNSQQKMKLKNRDDLDKLVDKMNNSGMNTIKIPFPHI